MKESTKQTLLFIGTVAVSVWVAQITWQALRLDRVANWVSSKMKA